MSSRYEPGPTGEYGSAGIPRDGMEERYSTALWRDNPGAFWLHPEGPLADTKPAEYFVPEPLAQAANSPLWQMQNPYANGLQNACNSGYNGLLNQAAGYPLAWPARLFG